MIGVQAAQDTAEVKAVQGRVVVLDVAGDENVRLIRGVGEDKVEGVGDRKPMIAEKPGEPVLLGQQRPGVDPGIIDVGAQAAFADADGDRAAAILGFGAENRELQA
ncbi:MAG: hypothetical protein M3Y33_02480 [Actinomycetota bacterium]|nr:hypothetical protein [Actinomycetota bacterium]